MSTETTLAEAKTEVPGAATFLDYRKMMDAMADRIDAVLVCTPITCTP